MAAHRITIVSNKKSAAVKHQKREIATLLHDKKDEKARIKIEHIIREDFMIESLELIQLLCELIHERIKYIADQKECPIDLIEAISSLLWATPHVDINELDEVKKQFILKYGKQFVMDAQNNANNLVNQRLLQKLSLKPPSAYLIVRYLEEIAKEYSVEWEPSALGLPKSATEGDNTVDLMYISCSIYTLHVYTLIIIHTFHSLYVLHI